MNVHKFTLPFLGKVRPQSAVWSLWLLWPDLLLGSFLDLGEYKAVLCFEQLWKTTSDDFSYPVGLESAVGHETTVLFTALVLYR